MTEMGLNIPALQPESAWQSLGNCLGIEDNCGGGITAATET